MPSTSRVIPADVIKKAENDLDHAVRLASDKYIKDTTDAETEFNASPQTSAKIYRDTVDFGYTIDLFERFDKRFRF